MASSLTSNTIQVYFDSVLEMENEGMVAMFEALISSGLSGFLGCSSAIFETALVEFFHNASVRDSVVVSTIQGKPVAISEELFASTLKLPLEGLSDLHEGVYITTLLATRAWLRPVSRGNRHFTVDCGRQRQSGPRPKTGFLRQPTLEGLMRSARTDSPRQDWPEQIPAKRRRRAPGGGGEAFERRLLDVFHDSRHTHYHI
ncbi:mucin-2-like [Dorcoceras hygrometricum]|uniref:Mucin-2-like n=1 Tax=Dorcoceras hygrometricum TaxID=472368 RepID=A0A2Z7DHP7_9LAMI|nr:mucin-2-like [Dorcoceras hygrometricum]